MAANDELRLMFAGMDLTQKANFIANLEKSLEGSEDEEGMMFLDECKAHYTMELEAEAEVAAEAVAPEADVAAEPEIELGPEPVVDEAFEPEIELGPEPVAEDILEPELLLEPDALLEAEVEAETEAAIEEELVPEPEVALEEDLLLEPEAALEEEPILEPEVILEEEMVLEAEIEEEIVAELEPEAALELEPMLEAEIEAELEAELEIEPELELMPDLEPEPLPVAKSRIDCIEMEISDLADSIRNKMGVIDTISHLLSGEGVEIVKSVAEAKGFEPAQPLESTSAYESKVDSIKESISEFADNILQDIRVMEAISNLLSGSDETGDTQPKKKSASASAK